MLSQNHSNISRSVKIVKLDSPSHKDSGYAWVVLMAVIFNGILYSLNYVLNGMFMIEYTRKYGISSDKVAWVVTTRELTKVASMLIGFLVRRFNHRTVGLCGSLLLITGTFVSSVYPRLEAVVVAYGILSGVGQVTLLTVSVSAIPCYFDKRISTAMGLFWCGTSIGNIAFPVIFENLYKTIGLQSSLLLETGFAMQALLCIALLRPVQHTSETRVEGLKIKGHTNGEMTYINDPKTNKHTIEVKSVYKVNEVNIRNQEHSFSNPVSHDDLNNTYQGKTSDHTCNNSTQSDATLHSSAEYSNTTVSGKSEEITRYTTNKEKSNLQMHKYFPFWIFILGNNFSFAGFLTMFIVIPFRVKDIGGNLSLVMSTLGISGLFMRFIGGFVSDISCIAKRRNIIMTIVQITAGLATLIGAFVKHPILFVVYSGTWGFLGAYYPIISPIVLKEMCGVHNYPVAIGVSISFGGIVSCLTALTTGYLLELFQQSSQSFLLGSSLQIAGGVFSMVGILLHKNARKASIENINRYKI